jgi:putative YphP/YqiW family bacilliredoxin
MRDELTRIGVEELRTPAEVDAFMERPGTKLVVVNSVCGCAAGQARPGVALALQHEVRPEHVGSVFAGQDLEATARARSYLKDCPPSSPSIALLRGKDVLHFVPRHAIEGTPANEIAFLLAEAFEHHCR